jgi:hypothetical protein
MKYCELTGLRRQGTSENTANIFHFSEKITFYNEKTENQIQILSHHSFSIFYY